MTIFDRWARDGKSDLMEIEHAKTACKFLRMISFGKQFLFLDVGCGNGWIIRKIAKLKNCKKAVGIDKSIDMIKNAVLKKSLINEHYIVGNIVTWRPNIQFNYIFSMESLYYIIPMELALSNIYRSLKPNGKFFCGTDFYKDNKSTIIWKKHMKIDMDLRSEYEWKQMFEDIGFKTEISHIKDQSSIKKWRREFGTLFITGIK